MKNKTNNIFIILISILLLASSILATGGNCYYKYLQVAGFGLASIFFVIRLIQKKPIKIIRNSIDLCVIILVLSTLIPVISNQYVSLYGSIKTILEYMYLLSMYLLIREVTKGNEGLGKVITNILILSVIILIILGVDGITINNSKCFLEILKKTSYENGDNRLISTFGYSNTLGVYIASVMFLNFNEYLKKYKIFIKAVYKTITFIFMTGIILTYSKGIFLILPLILIGYVIAMQDKWQKLEVTENIIISIILATLFTSIFDYLTSFNYYMLICILFGIFIIITYVINLIIELMKKQVTEINYKKIFIAFGILMLIAIIYITVGLNIYEKYEVFKKGVASEYKAKAINNIKRRNILQVRF